MKIGSFREKFNNLKQLAGGAIFYCNYFFDLIDKETRVKRWGEKTLSKWILIGAIVAFLVVTFLPIRYAIALAPIAKFKKDGGKHKMRYYNNVECSKILIKNFFIKNQIYTLKEIEGGETWYTEMWDTKKTTKEQFLLMKQEFQKQFDIILPENFQIRFNRPKKLCDEAGFVDLIFELDPSEPLNAWDLRYNPLMNEPDPNPLLPLINLFNNFVPTEVYVTINSQEL